MPAIVSRHGRAGQPSDEAGSGPRAPRSAILERGPARVAARRAAPLLDRRSWSASDRLRSARRERFSPRSSISASPATPASRQRPQPRHQPPAAGAGPPRPAPRAGQQDGADRRGDMHPVGERRPGRRDQPVRASAGSVRATDRARPACRARSPGPARSGRPRHPRPRPGRPPFPHCPARRCRARSQLAGRLVSAAAEPARSAGAALTTRFVPSATNGPAPRFITASRRRRPTSASRRRPRR